MSQKVLVAYGTRYGATAEIAEKIGEVLREADIQTDVIPAGNAGDLSGYGAFVIGSAVYVGRWTNNAVNLVEQNIEVLAGHPVWIFSSGPTGEGDIKDLMSGWEYPGKLRPAFERIKPRDITVFHGTADPDRMSFLNKIVLKMVKAPTGDFRNWDVITDWANGIISSLKD